MSIECVVIDAGARYGLHPSWQQLQNTVQFHLFEMDKEEAARLTTKYKSCRNIHVHAKALFSKNTTITYKVNTHRGLNSLYETNSDLLERNDYLVESFSFVQEEKAEACTIDSAFSDRPVHFMKLDVEGAEIEILKGARRTLKSSVLGVRSEAIFAPLYKGAPLFGDIHQDMLEQGFELLNLDYSGCGNKAGRYTMPGRYGKLISTDAVWVVNDDRLFAAQGDRLRDDIIRFSLFLMLNHATDLAVDTLIRAVEREGVDFSGLDDDPVFKALHTRCLFLFKDLLTLPMVGPKDSAAAYRSIFKRDFPLMNNFYESAVNG